MTGAGTGVEEMDRLAATASSLKEAVGVLRRFGVDDNSNGSGGGKGAAAEDAAMAGRRAMAAVKELAGLLASEVCTIRYMPTFALACCCVFSCCQV